MHKNATIESSPVWDIFRIINKDHIITKSYLKWLKLTKLVCYGQFYVCILKIKGGQPRSVGGGPRGPGPPC